MDGVLGDNAKQPAPSPRKRQAGCSCDDDLGCWGRLADEPPGRRVSEILRCRRTGVGTAGRGAGSRPGAGRRPDGPAEPPRASRLPASRRAKRAPASSARRRISGRIGRFLRLSFMRVGECKELRVDGWWFVGLWCKTKKPAPDGTARAGCGVVGGSVPGGALAAELAGGTMQSRRRDKILPLRRRAHSFR